MSMRQTEGVITGLLAGIGIPHMSTGPKRSAQPESTDEQ
jgi:hypothetical protein